MPRAAPFAEGGALRRVAVRGLDLEWVAGLGAAAVAGALMVDPASSEAGPVICPFRLLTGLPCPGCGLTRSWIYLLHGQWTDGLVANPFGIVALTATVALITAVLAAVVRGRELPSLDAVMSSPAVRGGALVWVAFGVARAVVVATGHDTV